MTTPPHIEKAARLAYNAAVMNEEDDGWWDKFTEGERDEWRRATLAVLSTTKEQSEEEVEAATRAHSPVVFIDTTGWDKAARAYQAAMKAAALTHMRDALIAAAKVRVGE